MTFRFAGPRTEDPDATACVRPRTEANGFRATAWRVTRASKKCRSAARARFRVGSDPGSSSMNRPASPGVTWRSSIACSSHRAGAFSPTVHGGGSTIREPGRSRNNRQGGRAWRAFFGTGIVAAGVGIGDLGREELVGGLPRHPGSLQDGGEGLRQCAGAGNDRVYI